ncbi:MAG TPA: APC family permease [Planctomycetota bacterium]|nr:APC family permease [Planctomycetota bacterium]
MAAASPEPVLDRSVGLTSAVGFGMGAMVGTGLFVTTAIGAGLAGPAVLVSLAVAGGAAVCNGLSSASLAMIYPRSGGTYEYAGRRISPGIGFLAGWLFLAAKTTSAAATALAFGGYVGRSTGMPPLALSFALVVGVTILNFFRLTRAGAINLALVAMSLLSLLAFVATGIPRLSVDRFSPFAPAGAWSILPAASLLFVAYAGYGRVATLGEEIADPPRNIPIAVVISLAVTILLYLGVTAVALGTVGAEAFARSADGGAPLRDAAGPDWVKNGLSAGAATALASVFLNLMLGLSRMAFAIGRGGELPRALSRVNRASSPYVAVLAVGGVVAGLVAVRSIVTLLGISAFTVLVYYSLTNLSAIRLRPPERLVSPAAPAVGLLCCLALIASVPPRQLAVGAGVLAAGVLWRLLWRARFRTTLP